MNVKEILKFNLDSCERIVIGSIEKMRDHQLVTCSPKGGPHPYWVLGHLAFAEGMVRDILYGEPNPLASWDHWFNYDTEVMPDTSQCPSFDELLSKYHELRAENLKILDSLTESDFDKPTVNPPEPAIALFQTFGHSFLFIANHQMAHRGQVAASMRTAGVIPTNTAA